MREITKHKKVTVTRGSGNVFADLGLPNAGAELAKGKLIVALAGAIQAKGLKQTEAARLLGLTQPKISKLLRGDSRGFSTDKILNLLVQVGRNVDIEVTPTPPRALSGQVRVCVPTPVYAAAKRR